MRYRYRDSNGEDMMEIDTKDDKVIGVSYLIDLPSEKLKMTPEQIQHDLGLYLARPGATLEDALAAYAGGYGSWRRVEG